MRGKRGWTEGKMIPGRGKTIYNGQGETWPVGGVITANLEHRLRWVRAGWCRVRLEQLAGLLCPCRGVPPPLATQRGLHSPYLLSLPWVQELQLAQRLPCPPEGWKSETNVGLGPPTNLSHTSCPWPTLPQFSGSSRFCHCQLHHEAKPPAPGEGRSL